MKHPKLPHVILLSILTSLTMTGCGTIKPISILSKPGDASIRVNNAQIGTTPTSYPFDFSKQPVYVVSASKPGYVDREMALNREHPMVKSGNVIIQLQEDEIYQMTVESEAANRWLRVQINPEMNKDQSWQRIVDSVTTVYDSIEQLDPTAGYIRTSPKVRMFNHPTKRNVIVRTYLVGAIASAEPLTYRFQVRSQTRPADAPDHMLVDYGRIFREDAQLIQELQLRLGLQ